MLSAGSPAAHPLAPTAEPPPAWRTAEAIGAYRRDAEAPRSLSAVDDVLAEVAE